MVTLTKQGRRTNPQFPLNVFIFNYLTQKLSDYHKANPSGANEIAINFFGVNGESSARTRETLEKLTFLSVLRGESQIESVDYVFDGRDPKEIIERLKSSPTLESYIASMANEQNRIIEKSAYDIPEQKI